MRAAPLTRAARMYLVALGLSEYHQMHDAERRMPLGVITPTLGPGP